MWSPAGSQAVDQGTHLLRGFGHVCLGSLAADRGVHDLGFRCVLGLLIWCSQSWGRESGGARGHSCCGEFSKQPLSASIFSLSFFFFPKKFLLFKPPRPHPDKHLASHTAHPGPLPRMLQQTLRPWWGQGAWVASATLVPALVPGTLLSLSTLLSV